jgi:hypothetical protein
MVVVQVVIREVIRPILEHGRAADSEAGGKHRCMEEK